jgi:PhnB protein
LNIPSGLTTVTPYLFLEEPEIFLDFVTKAFGAKEIGRTTRPDGIIANLQILIGTSTLMLSQSSDGYPQTASAYYIYVENADESMKQAMNAGAKLEMEVADMPYNDRQGGVKDPCGNLWWISQRLVTHPYHGT